MPEEKQIIAIIAETHANTYMSKPQVSALNLITYHRFSQVNKSLCFSEQTENTTWKVLTIQFVLAHDLHLNVDRGCVVIEGRLAGVQAFVLLCDLGLEDHCIPFHSDKRAIAPETQDKKYFYILRL